MADGPRPPGRRALAAAAAVVVLAAFGWVVAGRLWPSGPPLASAVPSPAVARPAGWVDVRLASTDAPGALGVGLTGAGRVRALGGGEHLADVDDGVTVVVPAAASGLVVDGRALPDAIQIEPSDGEAVTVGDRSYRGALHVVRDGDGARVVNRLPVDHYLFGVVSEEMPFGFGAAALEAQAVAARSWVLARLAEGGTIHPDARSQVYAGLDGETFASHDAVVATAGLVLTWRGEVAPAWYHSTCGGLSRPAGEVFPGAPDGFLDQARPCAGCGDSPYANWTRRFDAASVCAAVDLPAASLAGASVGAATPSARALTVEVSAGGRRASMHAEDFRVALSRGRKIRDQVLSTFWSAPPIVDGGELVVRGRGWGHGVGLCQYGAGGMASDDASSTEILAHYYPGTRLVALPLVDTAAR